MPALTISAVDHTADLLTSVGHGLVTGDGPVAVRALGGALPSPLVKATDYWAIRIDDDTFKLAASSADAGTGTPINLTDNGSGTLQLGVGLPYRRARTYAAGAQVKSADLNALQDVDVDAKHAETVLPLHPHSFHSTSYANITLTTGTYEFTGAAGVLRQLEVPAGKVIDAVAFAFNRNGSGDITFTITKKNPLTGAVATLDTVTINSGTGLATHTFALGYEVEPGYVVMLSATFANGQIFHGAQATVLEPW